MHITSRYEIEWKKGNSSDHSIYFACVRGMTFGMLDTRYDSVFKRYGPWQAWIWDEENSNFSKIGGAHKKRADAIEAVEREICRLIGVGEDPMTSPHPDVVHLHAGIVELATQAMDGLAGSFKR